jgi:hypothetical protein
MRKRYISIIVLVYGLLGLSNLAFAGFRSDSLYLRSFSRKVSTRLLVGTKEFSFSISNGSSFSGPVSKVIYKPNNGIIGGIGLSYRNILISYYFNVSGTEQDNQKYGKTTIDDYQVNLTSRFFYISGFHRTYDGFYVSRPKESYSDWNESMPYPQRSDIYYNTKGIETIINLNPNKYSLNASLKLTEQQLQSVFSPLVYFNYSITTVSADSSLIPIEQRASFFDGHALYQSNFKGWSVMPGISFSLVKGRWFINPMFFSGFGYLQKELFFTDIPEKDYKDYYFRISSKLNLGYNNKRFFCGAFVEWSEMFLPEENLMIKTGNFNVMLMAGYRF